MREMGIKAIWIRPVTKTTISSNFSNKLKNILNRRFNPVKPNAVWATDITYIWTALGFVYLNCIMDLYSRRIIAWTLSTTLAVESVIETVQKAIAKNRNGKEKDILIMHTDRGCQYTSEAWSNATNGMICSYSDKGVPYDNACIESFHALIKREWLHRFKIQNYEQAYILVFEYIEAFYNTVRIHSHCNYVSPDEFECKYYAMLDKKAESLVKAM